MERLHVVFKAAVVAVCVPNAAALAQKWPSHPLTLVVPFAAGGPSDAAMQDLIAGRVDYMCDSPSTSLPQIESNMIKAIATTGQQRAASLVNIPTALEQGLNFDVTSWQGLFMPKGTPEPIVRRLTQAISEAAGFTVGTRSFRGYRGKRDSA